MCAEKVWFHLWHQVFASAISEPKEEGPLLLSNTGINRKTVETLEKTVEWEAKKMLRRMKKYIKIIESRRPCCF